MEAAMLRLCTTVLFISVVTRVTGAGVAGLFVARSEVTEVEICWESAPAGLYRLQHCVALSGEDWRDVGAPVAGTGGRACVGDGVSVGQGFYRVSQVGGGLEGAALTASIQISEVRQCWETATNLMYQLQERSELSGNGWTDVGAPRGSD